MNRKIFSLILMVCLSAFSNANADDKTIASGNNDFGINLYKQVSANSKGNVLISPYSIYGALGIAYAGAENNTKAEFEKTLNIQDLTNFHPALGKTIKSLNDRDGKGFSISVANALWISDQAKILASYTDLTSKYYSTSENQIDVSDANGSAAKINDWVADKTNNKINGIISADSITHAVKLIITNAIYFKGKWQFPFEKAATGAQDFTPLSAPPQKMWMMHQQKHFAYAEIEGAKFLELPYASDDKTPGGNLSMVLILPDQPGEAAFKVTENNLSNDLIQKFESNKTSPEVEVTLPKFKIETPVLSLTDMLKTLGLKDAFTSQADFSGITHEKPLFISEVFHKAMIDVNEEGTEAVAASAVMATGAAFHQPEHFTADRPFIYMIRDNESGLVLFIGKLLSP